MNFESNTGSSDFEKRKPRASSKRLLLSTEVFLTPFINKVKVIGRENIEKIPNNKKVVIASSHLSDLDTPIVIKVSGNDFDTAVSDQSTHHSFSEDPISKINIGLAGEDNFLPIDWKKTGGVKVPQFNPDNFTAMVSSLGNGKDVLVVAYNPSSDLKLPRGAIGNVYLSQL